jgi:hypothetical protein
MRTSIINRYIPATLAIVALVAFVTVPLHAQFGFGWNQSRASVVAQFDKDGDGRLNAEERRAAREALGQGGRDRGFSPFGPQRGRGRTATGPQWAPADVRPPYPTTSPYDLRTLRTLFLDFEDSDWEDELAVFYRTDVEVPATLTVDGRTYKDVGVRFRGSSSFRMVSPGYKRPMRLSLDFVHDDQNLRGYTTLNLLNGMNDPTFLRTVLYSEIARQYVPTAKANFVRLVINGESWGIYTNLQQFDRDFIQDWFKVRRGERWRAPGSPNGRAGLEYLGDNPARYKSLYEIRSRDDEESWVALIQLTRILNETPLDQLESALAPVLDIEGVLKFLALDVVLVNSDGYWARASDYNLYRDVNGRFHVIPHDINEALGAGGGGGGFRGGGRGGPDLDPLVGLSDPSKPLRSRLLAVPALRDRYLAYVRDIAMNGLDWKKLEPIVQASHRLIAADVRADTRRLYDVAGFEAVVADSGNPLKTFVERRREYLLAYTSGPGAR